MKIEIKNIAWLVFDKAIKLFLSVFVMIWLANYLGPELFGKFNLATSIMGIFSALAALGMHGVIVRDILEKQGAEEEVIGSAIAAQLLCSLVSSLMMIFFVILIRPDDDQLKYLVILCSLVILFRSNDAMRYWFEAKIKSKYVVITESSVLCITGLLRILAIVFDESLEVFFWIMVLEVLLCSIGIWILYIRKKISKIKLTVNIEKIKYLIGESWPLVISSLVLTINTRIDQIMIAKVIDDHAVGTYAAAVRIAEIWYFLPIAIVASFYPMILESKKTSVDNYRVNFQRLFNGLVCVSLGVAITISIFSEYIITTLYGEEFKSASEILSILTWCGLFASLSVSSGRWYVSEGLQKMALARNTFGVVVNVFLNLIWLPKYGLIGACYATLIAQVASGLIFDCLGGRTYSLFLMKMKALLMFDLFFYVWRVLKRGL